MSEKHYQVLVTRDCTESAMIPVTADGAEAAANLATSRETVAKYNHLFAANDGGSEDAPYLGDPDEDVEQISEAEYLSLVYATKPTSAPKLVKPFELVIKANVLNEFAEGPEFAVVTVDQTFIDSILRLREICKLNDLESAIARYSVDAWDGDEEYRLRGENLRVSNHASFWFESYMKFSDINVETQSIDIDRLLTVVFDKPLNEATNDFARSEGRLFYSHDKYDLEVMVEQFKEQCDE